MKKQILMLILTLLPMVASAHDIEAVNAQGKTIYYVWTNNKTELAVSCQGTSYTQYSNEYSGDVIIPESVYYNGETYSVTSIGNWAFYECTGLTSITIPNSVTSIGDFAFYGCSGLTSITIPNSVTSIGNNAFYGCSGLTSVTIPNSVTTIDYRAFMNCSGLTSITIPNSVTSIGEYAFYGCSSLTSIAIPSNLTSINNYTFYGCSKLSSATIPEGVTAIGNSAFSGCGLTSVIIPNSVTTIGEQAFYKCSKLTDVKLPDVLTIIKKQTFQYCSALKNITIPAEVELIYQEAFANCAALESVKAVPETPPFLYENSFSNYNIPLYAPKASVTTYQGTSPWSNFAEFKILSAEDIEIKQCATPTIKYNNGKLHFECETEDVEYIYSFIPPTVSTNQNGNDIDLPTTYTVTVYAKKEGYMNSDIATADIDVRGIQGDTNRDGKVTISDAVGVVNIILNNGEPQAAPALEEPIESMEAE